VRAYITFSKHRALELATEMCFTDELFYGQELDLQNADSPSEIIWENSHIPWSRVRKNACLVILGLIITSMFTFVMVVVLL